MSTLVVDASVVAKCLLPDEDPADARRVIAGHLPIAPELVMSECANAFWKRTRSGMLLPDHVAELRRALGAFPLTTLRLRPLTALALHFAVEHGHPVYDCYYLAAAIRHRCPLVTADKRLAALADEVGLRDRVILIGGGAPR